MCTSGKSLLFLYFLNKIFVGGSQGTHLGTNHTNRGWITWPKVELPALKEKQLKVEIKNITNIDEMLVPT